MILPIGGSSSGSWRLRDMPTIGFAPSTLRRSTELAATASGEERVTDNRGLFTDYGFLSTVHLGKQL